MRCNESEPRSLGALLSQGNDPPQTSKQHSMLSSLCGSTVSLKSIATSSSSKTRPPPPSPTTSVSNSNALASSNHELNTTTNPNTLIQALKFEAELEGEIQSPIDNSIWDSLFSDQIDSSSDFMLVSSPRRDFMISSPRRDSMISSPRRDYMIISSPRRDYMISSPKRDNMIFSPRREYMISSPKREYMVSTVASPKRMGMSNMSSSMYNSHNYGYGNNINSPAYSLKGKAQSPLYKVLNSSTTYSSCSSSSTHYAVQGEALALPTMDALLYEYGLYSNLEVYDVEGTTGTGDAVEGMTTTLLECMSMPSLNMKYGDGVGVGVQLSNGCDHHGDDGDHGHGHHGYEQQMMGGGSVTKTEVNGDGSSYHGLLGTSGCDQNEQDQDNSGLQLVHLLLACAEAISKSDYVSARRYLHHLNHTVSPLGDSMQRVASCFADALSARLNPPLDHHHLLPSNPSLETLKIYQILYQACPYIKFAHFTANQAIFEAFETEDRVHVIDLDILQGYQWPAFLQALAARPGGPPSLRITGVGYPAEIVRETGRQLANLAHSLRVPFEFHVAVADRLEDLRPHMLHRRVGEALAVNSVNRLHRVPGPHLGNLLAMIRDQAPNIVTLVEQEASHNGTHFLGRFLEALHYYSAIFDSLDATFPLDSAARAKVEQYIFLPEIRNIVACEGPDRIERHERLEKWRKAMEGKGFTEVPLSQNAVTQSNILLGLYSCEGYRLTQDRGCLLLGWQDRTIVAASAWRC